jgi:UDP-glucose 4-epimerase
MSIKIEGGKFLIAGGASLVGSHLVSGLIEKGAAEIVVYDPVLFDVTDSLGDLKNDTRVRLVSGDVMKLHQLITNMEDVDGAVNLAAYMSLGFTQNPWDAIDVNIKGHLNFLESARLNNVGKVIFASSSAVYGFGVGGGILEDMPHKTQGNPPGAVAYGSSKIIGEQLCRMYKQNYDLDYLALRFSTVYGENQHHRAANALYIIETYERLVRGEPPLLFGDGSESKDFVYVGDVALGIIMALESDATDDTMNISGGLSISTKELVALITQIVGSEIEPEYIKEEDRVRLKTGVGLHYVNTKAYEVIGWRPEMPLEEGIRRLIRTLA